MVSKIKKPRPALTAPAESSKKLNAVPAASSKVTLLTKLDGKPLEVKLFSQKSGKPVTSAGKVSMIENSVDASTGMVMARATMPNSDDLLWPGTLVTVQLTIRSEQAVTVPTAAVQISQSGSFVFVVSNGAAKVQQVTVSRNVDGESVIASGLKGGEEVVTAGHLNLTDGTRVAVRETKAGS